jgi:hypothetical protein
LRRTVGGAATWFVLASCGGDEPIACCSCLCASAAASHCTGAKLNTYESNDCVTDCKASCADRDCTLTSANVIYFEFWGGASFQTLGVMDDDMTRRLSEQGVPVAWGPPEKGPMRTILIVGLPLIIFLGISIFSVPIQWARTLVTLVLGGT